MNWILIGIVAGSIVTSGHDTKEACLGRQATLTEQKIVSKCVEAPVAQAFSFSTGATISGPIFYNR